MTAQLRVGAWNALRSCGVGQEACYPIIEAFVRELGPKLTLPSSPLLGEGLVETLESIVLEYDSHDGSVNLDDYERDVLATAAARLRTAPSPLREEMVNQIAYRVANAKLGEGPSVRCEGPTECEIKIAAEWVRRVLKALPSPASNEELRKALDRIAAFRDCNFSEALFEDMLEEVDRARALASKPLPPTDDVAPDPVLVPREVLEPVLEVARRISPDTPDDFKIAAVPAKWFRRLLTVLSAQSPPPAAEDGRFFERVAECVKEYEGEGFWRSCSGCVEGVDGCVSTKDYPFSEAFGCQLGGGCSDCGGIGAIWDTTDYDAMARDMLAADEARQSPPLNMGEGFKPSGRGIIEELRYVAEHYIDEPEALQAIQAAIAHIAESALAIPSLPEGMRE